MIIIILLLFISRLRFPSSLADICMFVNTNPLCDDNNKTAFEIVLCGVQVVGSLQLEMILKTGDHKHE